MAKVPNAPDRTRQNEDKDKAHGRFLQSVFGKRFGYEYLYGITRKKLGIKGPGENKGIDRLTVPGYKRHSLLVVNVDADNVELFLFPVQNILQNRFFS